MQDFRSAVEEAVGEDNEPVVEEGRMDEILSTLPQAYQLHTHILTQLDSRIQQWWEPTVQTYTTDALNLWKAQ